MVEHYAEITPQLRGKPQHRRRAKLAAALRAAAKSVRRQCRVFARGSAKLRMNFEQSFAIFSVNRTKNKNQKNDFSSSENKVDF